MEAKRTYVLVGERVKREDDSEGSERVCERGEGWRDLQAM